MKLNNYMDLWIDESTFMAEGLGLVLTIRRKIRHLEKAFHGSLLSGVAILVWPRLLNYIVDFYLILFVTLGLLTQLQLRF